MAAYKFDAHFSVTITDAVDQKPQFSNAILKRLRDLVQEQLSAPTLKEKLRQRLWGALPLSPGAGVEIDCEVGDLKVSEQNAYPRTP